MPYRPIQVANQFLRDYGSTEAIDHLKLQKLTYLAHGWWLAVVGRPLLTERPQVWRYGPVFQSLYGTLAGRGRAPIVEPIGGPFNSPVPALIGEDAESAEQLTDWIWGEYGERTGAQLSDLTHQPGTPWRNIAEKNKFRVPAFTEIPADEDWKYFAGLAKARGIEVTPLGR